MYEGHIHKMSLIKKRSCKNPEHYTSFVTSCLAMYKHIKEHNCLSWRIGKGIWPNIDVEIHLQLNQIVPLNSF